MELNRKSQDAASCTFFWAETQGWVKFDHLRQARPPVSCREVYVRALTDIPSL
jgi:hypothetical protein